MKNEWEELAQCVHTSNLSIEQKARLTARIDLAVRNLHRIEDHSIQLPWPACAKLAKEALGQ